MALEFVLRWNAVDQHINSGDGDGDVGQARFGSMFL